MAKRILSIDGGGLRGAFSAAVIEQIELAHGGRPACEIFDAFVGTSAGAVIAAGLAMGLPARRLRRLFVELGAQMGSLMRAGGTATSDAGKRRAAASAALEQVLIELLGKDTRAGQMRRRFAVVARNMARGRVEFMGNFPADQLESASFWRTGRSEEGAEPVWRMVLRSAALPPLFAPQGTYLDGGVSPFANPAYAAYIGVQRCLGWNPYREELQFHSVGTGYHDAPRPLTDRAGDAIGDELLFQSMIGAMMQDINFLQHQIMKRLRAPGHIAYHRYNIAFNRTGFERARVPLALARDKGRDIFTELASTATSQVERLAEIGALVGQHALERQLFALADADRDASLAYIPFGAPEREALTNLRCYDPDPAR
jgi:predicted acylesterase/phospholipase RssA